MGQKLPPQQMELYKRIVEVLFYKWDLIGISDGDWARDEYQSYLPQVFKLALENSNLEPIENYLTIITTENMGLSEAKQHDIIIAKLILEFKRRSRFVEVYLYTHNKAFKNIGQNTPCSDAAKSAAPFNSNVR